MAKRKQIKNVVKKRTTRKTPEFDGDDRVSISTGSTLLDLAISGGRTRRGGLPSGILVEVFGPESSGKTVLLSEIAGTVQRKGGSVMFMDPEARLDQKFAEIFGLQADEMDYSNPKTVSEVFKKIRKWDAPDGQVNGVFVDSLAALTTEFEIEKDGDKMGTRRSAQFSEQLRLTCGHIREHNVLVVCSNQIRDDINAAPWGGPRVKSTGGHGPAFYSSVRLRTFKSKMIPGEKTINGKKVKRDIGVEARIKVVKNSVAAPGREAVITIIFDYGIDDVKDNLQFLKQFGKKSTTYKVGETNLGRSLEGACERVEADRMEKELKKEVIRLWYRIDKKFKTTRKKRRV